MNTADFSFENHGSIWLVRPKNPDADAHLRESVEPDAQWFCAALVVEHRYVNDLAIALRHEGYQIAGR